MVQWEDRMQRGLFRYDLTACETKVIPGQFGFIAQLNEGAILRRGQRSFELIRFSSPLMAASLTSLKLNKRRFYSSLKPAKMVKLNEFVGFELGSGTSLRIATDLPSW
ncbi:hypothetical protein ACFX2H_012598 [Malus domestica]